MYRFENLMMKRFAIFLLLILLGAKSFSQPLNVQATAKVDTANIRIGEQFKLNLNVVAPSQFLISFPVIADTIHKLEVVERSKIDTAKSSDGKTFTYHQLLTLTAFDSGYHVIEPFIFSLKSSANATPDSVSTEAMLIAVKTIPVDTTKAIKDIKGPLDVPLTWKDFLPYIIGAIILGALIWLVIYINKKKKNKFVEVKPKIPSRPAHEIAIEALRKTEAGKLWQQGFYKQYHIEVSDIIRAYIEHRYTINAMEFTTDETLEHLRGNIINDEAREKLRNLLQFADMVKFAKAIPVGSENEQAIKYAYDFIALTKPVTQSDFVSAEQKEKKEVTA